jgi:chemotaxis protein CheX
MIEVFALPSRLDSSAAPSLLDSLMTRRGQPLHLDASEVELVGALALEVVIAAGRQWDLDGHPFSLKSPSDRFTSACDVLGLNATAPWLALKTSTPGGQA